MPSAPEDTDSQVHRMQAGLWEMLVRGGYPASGQAQPRGARERA